MDCSKYETKQEDLNELVNKILNKNLEISLVNVNLLSCLLCKNFDKELIPNILAYLEQLVAEDSYNSINWYALARINQVVANNFRAEEAYQKAINLEPLNVDYLERMARFYTTINNWQKTLEYCNRLVGQSPDKQQMANSIMLSVFYSCKMYAEAIQNFELGIDLTNLQSIYKAMYSYVMLNKYNKVVELVDKIELSDNDESYALIDLIAQSYFTLKDYDKALEHYLKLSKKNYEKYRNDVAATYSNMSNFECSMPILEEILDEDPNDINALSNYALSVMKIDKEKNFDKAVEYYLKVIKIDCKNQNAYNMLAILYYETKKYDLANSYYGKLLELTPNSEWVIRQMISCAFGNLALGNDIKGNARLGISLCSALKNSFKMSANDYITASIFYRIETDFKSASESVLRAVEMEPTNPYFLFSAALTFKAMGNNSNARNYIEKAVLIENNNLDYLILYADILVLLKDKSKAEKIYKKIVEIKEDSDTLNALGWFYCEEKIYTKAIPTLRQALYAELKENGTQRDFIHRIKSNLAYVYIMDSKSKELLELMNSEEFAEIYSDDFSNGIKAITYLTLGDTQKADEYMPLVLTAAFPEKFSLLFKAFSAYNFREDNWYKICIDNLKAIEFNDPNYIAFKEDICRCLGYAYRQNGDDNALTYFKQACEIGKSNAENWYELGMEYLYCKTPLNNKQDAYQCFETAYMCENGNTIKPLRYIMGKFQLRDNLTAENKADIMLAFFSLASKIEQLKQELIYTDLNPVYHFTSLGVLKELVKKDGRLRISNAAHMNDPEEGKTIFRKIFENYKSDDELDELTPPNIFLTSFCLVGDILPLWSEYGDRGKGCSLAIPYDFFDKKDNDFYYNFFVSKGLRTTLEEDFTSSTVNFVKNQISDISEFATQIMPIVEGATGSVFTGVVEQCQQIMESVHLDKGVDFISKLFEMNKPENAKEKYCLYKVVYLNDAGKIVNSFENKRIIQELLSAIKEIIKEFQSKEYSADMKNVLKGISLDLFAEIQYLFKMDSYSYEQEVRVVKSRLLDDTDVKEWAPDNFSVPNLFIDIDRKPYFSLCTFGTKVAHPSKLSPYLYRSKAVDKIEKSTIKYR